MRSFVKSTGSSPPPRRAASHGSTLYAERYLALVSDLPTWDSYRLWLVELLYPLAWEVLFGGPQTNIRLVSAPMLELDRQIAARRRFWLRRSSEVLARKKGPYQHRLKKRAAGHIDADGPATETTPQRPLPRRITSLHLGPNIDTLATIRMV